MAMFVLAGAAALVAGGVATNQVVGAGQVSWTWAYLALGFTVLASVASLHATQPSENGDGRALGTRRAYLRQLRASVADMETIGVGTHGEFVLRMRQVYVDVSLRPRPPQDAARDPGVGTAGPEPTGNIRPLRSFLGSARVFAVIGASGSGKTTLARHTALALCGWHWRFWRRRQLPVLLYLRDHAKSILEHEAPSLARVATSVGWLEGRISAAWMGTRLDKGRCVVLLDGLDEIADERDRKKVVGWIRRQIERYPTNTFVLTSRPHGYMSNPVPNADVLQVQRFTAFQISKFLQHWSFAVERRAHGRGGKHVRASAARQADDLLRKLRGGPAMYELAANPLLLTMIANVHRYRGALPRSRAALYSEMCDALIHRRQEAKNLTDATGLEGPKKELVMRHLALYLMRERVRDVPLVAAQDAVRRPLQQVTGEQRLTPSVFLDEVRKNGMLVAGEDSVCGFAHLSFQEYLAAAQIRDQPAAHLRLLTEGVDDPWWRETTLLWAAASDATPVIEACLASGTIAALTLAFDCADEALEIAPETRGRLNRLLGTLDISGDDTTANERRRLIAAVTASRGLREIVWQGTTAVCAQPVTRDLYGLFVLDERAVGRHFPIFQEDAEDGASPAVGVWADDAVRFVNWLNALFDDGPAYRLPDPTELTYPDAALAPVLDRHTVWAGDGHHTVLHRKDNVPWPYTPAQDRLSGYPSTVPELIRPALRLAQVPRISPDRDLHHLLAYTHAFAPRLSVDPLASPARERTMAVDRARDLVAVIDLALDLAIDLGDMAGGGRDLGNVFDIVISLNSALRRELGLARELALRHDGGLDNTGDGHSAGLERALGRVDALSADLRYARHQVRPHVSPLIRSRTDGLARDLAVQRDTDQARELDRVRDQARKFARDLDHAGAAERARNLPLLALKRARDLDRDRALALELDLAPGRDVARDLEVGHARDLARDLSRALRGGAAPEHDLDRARSFDAATARASDLNRTLSRDLDRALAYDLARDIEAPFEKLLPLMVATCGALLRSWPAFLPGVRAGDGQARCSFERFLTKVFTTAMAGTTRTAEDPGGEIRHVLRRMEGDSTGSEVRSVVEHTHALIGPILDRTAPVDRSALALAGAGLLAAIGLLQQRQDRQLAGRLARALGTLIALGDDETEPVANQVLLLVRV